MDWLVKAAAGAVAEMAGAQGERSAPTICGDTWVRLYVSREVRPSRMAYLTRSAKLLKPSFSMTWRR